ncbi:DUF2946 domain-containing protein [Rhodobacterales bacterium]|nr:DUF2946 domain-containing protein [Rhodobacterales bacterium]
MTWLLALGVFLAALVPLGMMPGQNSASAYPIVICTGQGTLTVLVDEDGNALSESDKAPDQTGAGSSHPCVFATLHLAPHQPFFIFASSLPAVFQGRLIAVSVDAIRQSHARPLGARAPPSNA